MNSAYQDFRKDYLDNAKKKFEKKKTHAPGLKEKLPQGLLGSLAGAGLATPISAIASKPLDFFAKTKKLRSPAMALGVLTGGALLGKSSYDLPQEEHERAKQSKDFKEFNPIANHISKKKNMSVKDIRYE